MALLLLTLADGTAAQSYRWAVGVVAGPHPTGTGVVRTTAATISANGDVRAAYRFAGDITLGTRVITGQIDPNTTLGNCAVARHDADGAVGYVLLSGINARVDDLETDADGNLYAVGRFADQVTISGRTPTVLTPQGTCDYFVAKWDDTDGLDWVVQGQSTQSLITTTPAMVAVDSSGNVTLADGFKGTVTFGSTTVAADANRRSVLMAHFDSSGNLQWAYGSSAQTADVSATDLAVAPDGMLYLVGLGGSGLVWNGTTVPASTPNSGFWWRVAAGGSLQQQQTFFGTTAVYEPRVTADHAGTCYVSAGTRNIGFTWGSTTLTPPSPSAGLLISLNVLRLSATGRPVWLRQVATVDSGTVVGASLRAEQDFVTSGNSRLYVGGSFIARDWWSDSLVCGALSLPFYGWMGTSSWLAALDGSSGVPLWLKGNEGERVTSLDANAAGELAVGGNFFGDTTYFDSIVVRGGDWGQRSAFAARLAQQHNRLHGTAFDDANSNSTRDAGESGIGELIVAVQGAGTFFTSTAATTGHYDALVDLGNYTVSVPTPPRYRMAVPVGPTATFATYGNVSGGHDVAITAIPNQQDLTVHITPVSRARPGFAVTYRLTVRNVGTVAVAGAVLELDRDLRLQYVSSAGGGPVAQAGSTLVWVLNGLAPGEVRHVDVLFQLAVTTPLGTVLTTPVTVTAGAGTDLTPADNTETSTLTVTGSYDPNDIQVNYVTLDVDDVQQATHALDYTVRFQNMGTDTAFTVVLRDTLPAALLNLGTLQVLAASHPCTMRLGAGGVLTVSFPGINLPARLTNTLRSTGFVRFRLVPYTTLAVGDVIPNEADIYFDFNAPITTNTALTTIINPMGVPDAAAPALAGAAWPSPATDALHVAVEQPAGAALTLRLLDGVGRVVRTLPLPAAPGAQARATLDVRGLPAGLYVVRAAGGGRQWSRRVVVR